MVVDTIAIVVGNVGKVVVNMFAYASNNANPSSSFVSIFYSIECSHQVVQIHIYCLRFLKEEIGDCES